LHGDATMTSIILAGGNSLRFGWNKALETINGKSLVQHVVDCLIPLNKEIIIVTAWGENLSCARSSMIRTVADIHPGKGALGGIYSGLVISSCSRAIVVGCDMPFLEIALLEYLAQISSGVDVVVPRIGEKVEPLCAVYSKNCLVPIQGLLEHNELRIGGLFAMVRVRYVEEDEIDRFDPEHLSFFNVNTQADLDAARRLAVETCLISKATRLQRRSRRKG